MVRLRRTGKRINETKRKKEDGETEEDRKED